MVRAMVKRPQPIDEDAVRPLSHTTKLITAAVVFAFGVLAGAAIAALVVPPS
jgi:hypothetical protein